MRRPCAAASRTPPSKPPSTPTSASRRTWRTSPACTGWRSPRPTASSRPSGSPTSAVNARTTSPAASSRTSLAIALLGTPELVVLDEPTVGLDPLLRAELWGIFRALADSGITLIVSSHVMDEANRCDDLLLMRQGRIVAHTTPADLLLESGKSDPDEAFLELIRRDAAGPRHSIDTPNEAPDTAPRHAQEVER